MNNSKIGQHLAFLAHADETRCIGGNHTKIIVQVMGTPSLLSKTSQSARMKLRTSVAGWQLTCAT